MATLNIKPLTIEDLATAKMVDMVAYYNRLTGKAILKFQDRATAVRRCTELIEKQAAAKPIKQAEPPRIHKDAAPLVDPDATNFKKVAARNPLRQATGRDDPKPRPRSVSRDLNAVRAVMAERGITSPLSPMDMMASTLTAPPRKIQAVDSTRRRGPKPKWPLESRVELVQKTNPKRKGTLAYDEYEFYKDCKTVADYINYGGQLAYMNYDEKRGYIKIHQPAAKKAA